MNQELNFSEKLVKNGITPFGVIEELTEETISDRAVFEYIFSIESHVDKTTILIELQDRAEKLGVLRKFNKLLKAYQAEFVQLFKQQGSNTMQFTQPPIDGLKCGKWECRDTGVVKKVMGPAMAPQTITACPHPILPSERLINTDTGIEKVRLSFFKDGSWQSVVTNRSTIANKANIVQLADRGIEVTSENARELVEYISDVINLNTEKIPVSKGVTHLGWADGEFIPYASGFKYDGDDSFRDLYTSIKESGDFESWKKLCRELRGSSKVVHLLLAAAFASVLNNKLGILPFIIHLWGNSGTGKTVALMIAMSIWGNPEPGKLVRTLNSTQTALLRCSAFLKDIPFAADELQIIKTKNDNFDSLIMSLCEGVDKGRGKSNGGIEITEEWRCCFLFTGEEPITKTVSGGGVKNRVIEVEVFEKVVENGNFVSNFVRSNYGHAGRKFVSNLPCRRELQERYREISKEILCNIKTTEKQAMAMSAILLADEISTDLIFKDEKLTIDAIKSWLLNSNDISVSTRAYEWTLSWIAQNINKFKNNESGEIWGKYDELKGVCLVNKNVYNGALNEAGFDYSAVTKCFSTEGLIEKNSQGKFVHQTKVFNVKASYLRLNLNAFQSKKYYEHTDEFPF